MLGEKGIGRRGAVRTKAIGEERRRRNRLHSKKKAKRAKRTGKGVLIGTLIQKNLYIIIKKTESHTWGSVK